MSAATNVRPEDIVRKIGETSEQALRYVLSPDPQLSRLGRKTREALLPELPPVVAGALLGPEALARHFIASAAAGRYRDLLFLWRLFRERPEECKPVLAERSAALAKGRTALQAATRLGLKGHADRVAQDVRDAEGLIWQWLREEIIQHLDLVGRRPAVAAALLAREPDLDVPLPQDPDPEWVNEAAAVRLKEPLPPRLEALFAPHLHLLAPSIATLDLAHQHYPDAVPALLEQVDLDDPESARLLAWARDHGLAERLHARASTAVETAAATDRAEGLRRWYEWLERGVDLPLPQRLQEHNLDDLELTRPETAVLAARLQQQGAEFNLQARLELMAGEKSQLAEKAYEAMVCAGLDVTLPKRLENVPYAREGTRCPACGAWTWVRPGHEQRCPRPMPEGVPTTVTPEPDLAAEWTAASVQASPRLPEPAVSASSSDVPEAAVVSREPLEEALQGAAPDAPGASQPEQPAPEQPAPAEVEQPGSTPQP